MQVRVRSSSLCVYVSVWCVCVCVQTVSGRPAGLTWKATSLRSSDRNVATHVNAIISLPSPPLLPPAQLGFLVPPPFSCNCLLPPLSSSFLQLAPPCAAPSATTQRSRSLIVYEELCNVCLACSSSPPLSSPPSLALPSCFSHLLLLPAPCHLLANFASFACSAHTNDLSRH